MRLFVFLLFLIMGTATAWTICAQAAPRDCPNYYAVACHDDGFWTEAISGNSYAVVRVFDASDFLLSDQTVYCEEPTTPDPAIACPEWDPLFWIYCTPFPVY